MLIEGDTEDAEFSAGDLLCTRRLLAGIDCHEMGRMIGLLAWQVLALESGDSRQFRGQDSYDQALRVYARKLDIVPNSASVASLPAPNSEPASAQRPTLMSLSQYLGADALPSCRQERR